LNPRLRSQRVTRFAPVALVVAIAACCRMRPAFGGLDRASGAQHRGEAAWADLLAGEQLVSLGVEANARHSAEAILRSSPIVHDHAARGELSVVRAVYRL
jgi:hypothetical protein